MKKILVASGTSDNKLNFAVNFIKEYFDKNEIEVEVIGASVYEVDIEAVAPNVIVSIGPLSYEGSIPVVGGTAFITKIGMENCAAAIAKEL